MCKVFIAKAMRLHVILQWPLLLATPIPLIIDTDMGGGGCMDVDDVGAVCIANALADNGEAELLAIVQNTKPSQCAGVISVLNHYYGRDDVPIGAYKGTGLDANGPVQSFVPDLVRQWPSPIKDASQVPSSVEVYRQVLGKQRDHSVVISSIGLLTNLAQLLQSAPDHHSPLSGVDLVSQKVRLLSVMGGEFPNSGAGPQGCNFCGCHFGDDELSARTASAAASFVFSHMPPNVQILFSGASIGLQVVTGSKLSTCAPRHNPCRQAYIDYTGSPGKGRFSYDLIATLIAVRGVAAAGANTCTDCAGVIQVDAKTGANKWVSGAASNQTYLELRDPDLVKTTLDTLLCQPPAYHRATLQGASWQTNQKEFSMMQFLEM